MKKLRNDETGFSVVEIILVLVVVILIGTVGWLVYKNHHKTTTAINASSLAIHKPASSSTKITTKTPATKTPDTPINPTANWDTYTSTLGGFSFKYPSTGWTIYGNGSFTNPQISNSDTEIDLEENTGQGLSTNGNKFIIDLDIAPNSTDVTTETAQYDYSAGTVTTLSNNLQLWSSNGNSGGTCNSGLFLDLVNDGKTYLQLSNGKAITWEASFCWGYRATTTLTYQQQLTSPEIIAAKQILQSFAFNH